MFTTIARLLRRGSTVIEFALVAALLAAAAISALAQGGTAAPGHGNHPCQDRQKGCDSGK